MINSQHGRAAAQQELLNLHPGENVNIIQRLIPDIQMSRRQESCRDQDFLLLPFRIFFHVFAELVSVHIKFPKDCAEQTFIQVFFPAELKNTPFQERRILAHIGDHESRRGIQTSAFHTEPVSLLIPSVLISGLAKYHFQKAGLSASVGASQKEPFPLAEFEIQIFKDTFPCPFISESQLLRPHQCLFMMFQRHNLQVLHRLDILQETFLFPDLPLYASLHLADSAVHLFRLRPDVRPGCNGPVMLPDRIESNLRPLVFLCPSCCLLRRFFQFPDFFQMFFIFLSGKVIFSSFVFLPA